MRTLDTIFVPDISLVFEAVSAAGRTSAQGFEQIAKCYKQELAVYAAEHSIALSRDVVFAALSARAVECLLLFFCCGLGVIRIPLRRPQRSYRCPLSATTNNDKHNCDNQQEAVEYWLL